MNSVSLGELIINVLTMPVGYIRNKSVSECISLFNPGPKTEVIVVVCAVRAAVPAAGIKLAGVPQTKPMQ